MKTDNPKPRSSSVKSRPSASGEGTDGPGLDKRITTALRGITSLVKGVAAYCAAVVLATVGIKTLPEKLGLPVWVCVLVAFGPVVLLLCLQTIPAILEKRRRDQLKQIRGVGKAGYFQLAPRDDEESFKRADGKHQTVLAWLRQPPARLLYLTGASGVGKSSLLTAWAIPKLEREGTIVIRLRGYQDPAGALERELRRFEGDLKGARSVSADIGSRLESARERIHGSRVLVIFDQFEEFLILNGASECAQFLEFLSVEAAKQSKSTVILLVFREEYEGFIQELNLPNPVFGENLQKVSAFTEAAAREFLLGAGVAFDENLQFGVLREAAEVEGTLGLIKPVTANLCGLVLSRFATGLPRQFKTGRMIRGFVHESIFQPQIADVTPILLPRLISPHVTKVPKSIEDLSEGTGLTPRQVQGAMIRLGDPERAIVRPLDSAQSTWEISHDFLVPIIDSILSQWRPPALKTVLKWAPLAAASLVFLLVVVVPRLLPDPILDLEAEGWAIQPGVLQPLVKGKFPISYGLTCNGCTWYNLDVSTSDIRGLKAEIDINLTNISELDAEHLGDWSSLKNVRSLSITGADGKLFDISAVSELPNLESLTIISGSGLPPSQLGALPRTLTRLNVMWTALGDGALWHLPRGLDSLAVLMAPITDAAVGRLPRGLAFLNLQDTRVTDACIRSLPRGLISLNLDDNKMVTDSGLKDLPPSLQGLDLSGTGITDEGLKLVPASVTSMDLSGTAITDAGIKSLPRNLTGVDLSGTQVTAAGLKKLPPTVHLEAFRPQPPGALRAFAR